MLLQSHLQSLSGLSDVDLATAAGGAIIQVSLTLVNIESPPSRKPANMPHSLSQLHWVSPPVVPSLRVPHQQLLMSVVSFVGGTEALQIKFAGNHSA